MNIQEEMINNAAKELAADIDFEILTGMLCEIGWTKVILSPMTWEQGVEVDAWVEQNVKSPFETRGLVWAFEDSKEANWFTLRWLG